MNRSPTLRPSGRPSGRAAPKLPSLLPPVEGAALADGPGGVVLHLHAQGGGIVRMPLSTDALREIAALATSLLAPVPMQAGSQAGLH